MRVLDISPGAGGGRQEDDLEAGEEVDEAQGEEDGEEDGEELGRTEDVVGVHPDQAPGDEPGGEAAVEGEDAQGQQGLAGQTPPDRLLLLGRPGTSVLHSQWSVCYYASSLMP